MALEENLYREVVSSPDFVKGKQRVELFKYFYEHRDRYVTAGELENGPLGGADHRENNARIKKAISDLRKALTEVALESESAVHWELPEGSANLGYKLQLSDRPTELFWDDHRNLKYPPLIVYSEPTFFYDVESGAYIRYLDVNPDVENADAAVEALLKAHGKDLKTHYPGRAAFERLRPVHIYMGIGEVEAMEELRIFFNQRWSMEVRRKVSDRAILTEIHGAPILLGGRHTNVLIDRYLDSEEAKSFEYLLHPKEFKFVQIKSPTADEIEKLARYTIRQEDGSICVGNKPTLEQMRYRLVIVQRMQMPTTHRAVTMIMSEATLGIRQVAKALTDDDQTKELVRRLQNEDGGLPQTFEALYSVRIAPLKMQDEASVAELISVRKH